MNEAIVAATLFLTDHSLSVVTLPIGRVLTPRDVRMKDCGCQHARAWHRCTR